MYNIQSCVQMCVKSCAQNWCYLIYIFVLYCHTAYIYYIILYIMSYLVCIRCVSIPMLFNSHFDMWFQLYVIYYIMTKNPHESYLYIYDCVIFMCVELYIIWHVVLDIVYSIILYYTCMLFDSYIIMHSYSCRISYVQFVSQFRCYLIRILILLSYYTDIYYII